MKARLSLSLGAAILVFAQVAYAATPSWSQTLSGPPDGASYGDVDGDGQFEIALIVRGNPGQVVLLSHDGQILWSHTASGYLAGFPTFGDYDGNGTDEIAYCDLDIDSPCHVLNADGTVRYSFGSYYYPGMTGSGPTAVDVTGDGADDLVVLSWGGKVVLVDGRTGVELWSYDAWAARGEELFGPSTVADLDGDGDLEIVFGGYLEGTLFALDAATGTEVWTPIGLWGMFGGYFYGNGALVEDLEGDGAREIVVALNGDPPSIAAFSPTGTNLWRTTLPATAWFSWLTPVAADLDADGTMEILAQSKDGVLYVLDATGALIGSPSLGGDSWIAPGFIDLDFDLRPEIVAATVGSLLLLDGQTFAVLDRHDDAAGGMYPQILVGDLGGDGWVNVVAGSWYGASIYHYTLSAADVSDWSALGGSRTHSGGVTLACATVCASPDASVDSSANLGSGVLIGPNVTIGARASVGDDTIIALGASVGQRSTIGSGATIGAGATIERQAQIGNNTTVGEGAIVGRQTRVLGNVTIGANVVLDQGSVIRTSASIGEGTTIGQQSSIGVNASIEADAVIEEQVVLRANVSVGAGTRVGAGTTIGINTILGADVTIGKNCRIGRNVVIGDGVSIPDGTVIRNGSVLP